MNWQLGLCSIRLHTGPDWQNLNIITHLRRSLCSHSSSPCQQTSGAYHCTQLIHLPLPLAPLPLSALSRSPGPSLRLDPSPLLAVSSGRHGFDAVGGGSPWWQRPGYGSVWSPYERANCGRGIKQGHPGVVSTHGFLPIDWQFTGSNCDVRIRTDNTWH